MEAPKNQGIGKHLFVMCIDYTQQKPIKFNWCAGVRFIGEFSSSVQNFLSYYIPCSPPAIEHIKTIINKMEKDL